MPSVPHDMSPIGVGTCCCDGGITTPCCPDDPLPMTVYMNFTPDGPMPAGVSSPLEFDFDTTRFALDGTQQWVTADFPSPTAGDTEFLLFTCFDMGWYVYVCTRFSDGSTVAVFGSNNSGLGGTCSPVDIPVGGVYLGNYGGFDVSCDSPYFTA